ncbi:MAG TPA: cytochrome bc complex cytochrome b subunit [Longimicrobiales bacterium]|nr:cytochrome bc complex cytochrome b subunit [Longimicrobiales bacterium]
MDSTPRGDDGRSDQPPRKGPSALLGWLDDRLGFSALKPLARKKSVPVHKHSVWYYLGGMLVFLFFLQVATGILLLFYYRPSAEGAFESVRFLMAEVEFGWLIRSIHSWGANLMVFTAFLHMFSVLFMKAYRAPREITWMTGFGLMATVLGLGFTGYLLPWNELAFFATRVGSEVPGVIPGVGPFIRDLLRGGEEVTGATLTRFYALHVSVLPGAAIMLVALHVLLVQKHGMSVPPDVERAGGPRRSIPFFPNFLLRDLIGWLLALAILAGLAAFFPAELGEEADPFAPAPQGIRPEWYFMFMFQTLKMLPAHVLGIEGELVGLLAFSAGAGVLFFIPFLDRPSNKGSPARGWTAFVLGCVLFMVVMTWVGYAAEEGDAPGDGAAVEAVEQPDSSQVEAAEEEDDPGSSLEGGGGGD